MLSSVCHRKDFHCFSCFLEVGTSDFGRPSHSALSLRVFFALVSKHGKSVVVLHHGISQILEAGS